MDWLRDLVLPGKPGAAPDVADTIPNDTTRARRGRSTARAVCTTIVGPCMTASPILPIARATTSCIKTPATTCSSHRSTDPRASGRASIRAASCAWVRRDTTMRLARTRHTCHCLARSATWTNSIATCATTRRGGGGRRCWGGRRRRVAVDRSALHEREHQRWASVVCASLRRKQLELSTLRAEQCC